jgi:hypothetical protein
MTDARFDSLDPKNKVSDDELNTVAGGMSQEEARAAVNKILDGYERDDQSSSDDEWQDGFGRSRGGRLGGFK